MGQKQSRGAEHVNLVFPAARLPLLLAAQQLKIIRYSFGAWARWEAACRPFSGGVEPGWASA